MMIQCGVVFNTQLTINVTVFQDDHEAPTFDDSVIDDVSIVSLLVLGKDLG